MQKTRNSPRNTLGQRLLATFFSILLLTLIGSAIGLWSLYRVNGATDQMVQQSVATERLVADAYRYQEINAANYKAMALSSKPEVGDILAADILAAKQRYDALMKQVAGRLLTGQDSTLLNKIGTAWSWSLRPCASLRRRRTAPKQWLARPPHWRCRAARR